MNLVDLIKDREGFFWFVNNEFTLRNGGRIPFTRVDENTLTFDSKNETVAAVVYDEDFRKVHLTDPDYFEAFNEISEKYRNITGIEIEISKHYQVKR